MILSDKTIAQAILDGYLVNKETIQPLNIQSASLDVRLGNEFYGPYTKVRDTIFNPLSKIYMNKGDFFLGHTLEYFTLPSNVAAFLSGKSSLGRKGLFVQNAGFVDPGFSGQLVLELYFVGTFLSLEIGQNIAQVTFHMLDKPCGRPYGTAGLDSHYQFQTGAVGARA